MEVKEKIQKNIEVFQSLERNFKENPSLSFANSLVDLLMTGLFGIYSSEVLESFFANYGIERKKIREDFKEIVPVPNSCLHVVTKAYLTGGHTRVIERWIDACNPSEKHSVILLNQTNLRRIPNLLKDLVKNKNGDFIILPSSSDEVDKANKLRNIAFSYESIILHHHPNDAVPLMAFSAKEFNRPIVCFNHSGHTFWLGSSIVDFCIDIEKNQNNCTIQKRGIKNTAIIDMPVDSHIDHAPLRKESLKVKFNIPKEKVIISSMASMYKYTPMEEIDFVSSIRKILEANDNAVFIGIGITKTIDKWRQLALNFEGRVFLLGHVNYNNISQYLEETDLYIDSFPYNSWLSLIDAINIGKCPSLVLKTPVGYPNFIEGTYSLCNSIEELIEKSRTLLQSKERREKLFSELNESFLEKCSKPYFRKEINEIIKKTKNLNKFSKRRGDDNLISSNVIMPFDEYSYTFKMIPNVKEKGIKNIFQIIRLKTGITKTNKVLLFGFKLAEFSKNKLSYLQKKYKVKI
ncbi:hypothetical protein [Tenacibaculum maritimum]|uniref:hypothetical protein n=1 Tax=Tenacibaculum maritimum TaxID=107401 RepID=UPI001E4F895B|nr:hypothetical protein [Tenacibaculum maritimum]MCD9584363.1 hypothetical protein [Tenacibaculum maritimum]MCD9620116.1 hypothetical protein [Tenacibaculum maritimum]MCD9626243.1 hypothetical protein [Tenacibaculum maritimum]MCD9630707.1 hypothetical protein [Tenacibaculum maritimum]MCD9633483.1 hypothetical protein [Tenacibaculum maritimum]